MSAIETGNHPFSTTSIPRWLLALIAVGVLGLAGTEYALYRSQATAQQREAEADLGVIAALKVDQIERWRAERLADAASVAQNPSLTAAIRVWLAAASPSEGEWIRQRLRELMIRREYRDVLLADSRGRIRLSATGSSGPLCAEVVSALVGHREVITDLHAGPGDTPPHLDVVVPLFSDRAGQDSLVAAVILRNDAHRFLYPLIQWWPRPSRTAETLLVRRDGDEVLYLNELRFRSDAALRLRVPLSRTEVPAVAAVQGARGVIYGVDYRGVSVMAVATPVPGTSWHMVAKVDTEEVISLWRTAGFLLLGLLLALLMGVLTLAGALWQRQVKAQYRERWRTEAALRTSEAGYTTTLMSIGDGVLATDAAGRVTIMNHVAETLTGWPQAEARGRSVNEVFRIINEETRAPAEVPVTRVLTEGVVTELANHTILVARDGSERPIADSAAPIRLVDGTITGVVLVFRDQTQERLAEAQLRASEERYRLIHDSSHDFIYSYDREGRFTFANRELSLALGLPTSEIVGRTPAELGFPEAQCREWGDLHARVWAADATVVALTTAPMPDGEVHEYEVTLNPLHDGEGAIAGIAGTTREITASRRAQAELQAIYDAAPVMMCVIGAERRVLSANQAFRKASEWPEVRPESGGVGGVLGCIYSLDDPRGCGFGPHCQTCALRLAMVDTLASGVSHQDVEYRTILERHGRRQEIVLLGSITPFPSAGSSRLLLCLVDISERRHLEEELRRIERLRAVGELAAGVSHNLNNILTGVLLPVEALRLMEHRPEVRELIATIYAAGSRARDLVHRLHLSVHGVTEELLTAVPLNQTIEEAIAITRPRWRDEPEARGIRLELRLELQEVPPVRGTQSRLHDIVTNLVLNAVDAMPAGGLLSIATAPDGPFARLTIQDTGTGMDEETQRYLFQPFFTTKAKLGTGLGLSTVYSTVTHWGGRIEVSSRLGQGTTFRIHLPVADASVETVAPTPPDSGPGRRGRLLVVDDDDLTRRLLTRLLDPDHEVTTMDSGQTALAAFVPGRFDVAFIDLGMPDTPGDRLARFLREADPCLATVLITGWELTPEDPRRRQFDFLVGKPFGDLDRLAEVTVRAIALHDRRVAEG